MTRREFTVANEYTYDHRSPLRWLASHIKRYPVLLITFLLTTVGMSLGVFELRRDSTVASPGVFSWTCRRERTN